MTTELVASSESIPALIDEVMRELAEARDIETVREIHDKAEALRVYTQKRGAAIEAQNGCQKLVLLCERRIGQELVKLGMGSGINRTSQSPVLKTPTLKELGLTSDQSSEFQRLARTPTKVLDEQEKIANEESRRLSRAAVKRAGAKSKQPRQNQKPKLRIVTPSVPEHLDRVRMWLRAGATMMHGTGAEIVDGLYAHGIELSEEDVLPAYLRAKAILEAVREKADRAA